MGGLLGTILPFATLALICDFFFSSYHTHEQQLPGRNLGSGPDWDLTPLVVHVYHKTLCVHEIVCTLRTACQACRWCVQRVRPNSLPCHPGRFYLPSYHNHSSSLPASIDKTSMDPVCAGLCVYLDRSADGCIHRPGYRITGIDSCRLCAGLTKSFFMHALPQRRRETSICLTEK